MFGDPCVKRSEGAYLRRKVTSRQLPIRQTKSPIWAGFSNLYVDKPSSMRRCQARQCKQTFVKPAASYRLHRIRKPVANLTLNASKALSGRSRD